MMEKATITNKQAKAIEAFRENKWSDSSILYEWYKDGEGSPPTKLHESIRKMSLDDLAKSLYVGYEVEKPFETGGKVMVKFDDYEKEFLCTVLESSENILKVVDKDDVTSAVYKRQVRHLSTEESFWLGLGREVGEFKIGDVTLSSNDAPYLIESTDNVLDEKDEYHNGRLKGFFPVETLIKFNK